jgi:hypothetical protein
MKLIWLCLFLVGCAPHKKTVNIGSDFKPYYESFIAESIKQGRPVDVSDLIIEWGTIGDTPDNAICSTAPDETPTIIVNEQMATYFYNDTVFAEALIYHEMGHCMLARGHLVQTWTPDGGPPLQISIMYPGLPNLDFYGQYHDHYMTELFHGGNQ